MKHNTSNIFVFELTAYTLLAVVVVGFIICLFYFDPVHYTLFITEDFWAENCTFISLAISGGVMIILALRYGIRLQKVIWVIIGIVLIMAAGEEISWGMRIFGIQKSEMLREINSQGETNLHNLKALAFINSRLHEIIAYIFISWSIFSVMVDLVMTRLKDKICNLGLPLIPIKLIPMMFLPSYFWLFRPVVKSDEIGEMFFGIAMAFFAINLFSNFAWINKQYSKIKAFGVMIGTTSLVVALTLAMTYIGVLLSGPRADGIGWRLNMTAQRDYPAFGMYEQAQLLYEYIYANPIYIRPETRTNNAKMLLKAGKQRLAYQILSEDADLILNNNPKETQSSETLERLELIDKLMEQIKQDTKIIE